MTTGGFHADFERLASKAGEFDGFAERAGKIFGELRENLDAVGECWGTDEVGRSFAAAHSGPSNAVIETMSSLREDLGDMGTRLAQTASDYREVDAEAASGVQASGEE
ncbi:MAG: hypothetical protein GEU98_08775 [Pseudonocardiaceae bacterium]|nr:hypothetical protein [Pseudonocardiaceae bacterium]